MPVRYHYTMPRRIELALVTEQRNYPAHIHAGSYTVGLVCSGDIIFSMGREPVRQLRAGESFLVPPRTPHALELLDSEGGDSCRSLSVSLDENFLLKHEDGLPFADFFLLRQLCQELLEQGQVTLLEIKLLQAIVAKCLSQAGACGRSALAPSAMESIARNLARQPDLDSGLKELAASARLSPWHFLRLFKDQVGMTPHQFALACQVSMGRRLLRNGASPVEAALAAGFVDQSHFYRHFKRVSGLTPGAFSRSSVRVCL